MTLRQSVALVWRTLRSMRTALILLLMLALGLGGRVADPPATELARAGRAVPDRPRVLGTFLQRAGLFDVFGSWWFTLITVLLFVSLVACLIPRTRALMRALRAKPVQAREIDAFRHYGEVAVAATPAATIEASRRVLRRRSYRVASTPIGPRSRPRRACSREVGSLVFHWAFILILAGVIYGKGTGFSGYAVVVEGGPGSTPPPTTTDRSAPDGSSGATSRAPACACASSRAISARPASRWISCPASTCSNPDGSLLRSQDVRVNHPAEVNGISIYQINFGWAPRIVIEDADGVAFDDTVVMDRDPAPEGVVEFAIPWRGVVKLPGGGHRQRRARPSDRARALARQQGLLRPPGWAGAAGDADGVRPDHPVHRSRWTAHRARHEHARHVVHARDGDQGSWGPGVPRTCRPGASSPSATRGRGSP